MSRPPDGRMSLGDHLRELRGRLLKCAIAVVIGSSLGFIFFNRIWKFLQRPYCQVHQHQSLEVVAKVKGCGAGPLVFSSVFDPILWHFKVALIAGIVIASPVWLYQLWAFVTPGLQRKERRYSLAFVGIAVPLFLCGATLAYFVMSKGLQLPLILLLELATQIARVHDKRKAKAEAQSPESFSNLPDDETSPLDLSSL